MENITISIQMQKKQDSELSPEELLLINSAKDATCKSYSPYSHFSVGAALLFEDGTLMQGCNQENSSYPCGLCAERVALFSAGAICPEKRILAICIAARDTTGSFTPRPISPCGACRQVMSETEDRQHAPMRVYLYGTDGTYIVQSAKDTLPISFDASYL